MGATGTWNLDGARFARESLPPVTYLSSTYYEIWFGALEHQLEEHGLVSAEERVAGRALEPGDARRAHARGRGRRPRPWAAAARRCARPRARRASRSATACGRATSTRDAHPPAALRPRPRGTVELVHGCHVFPDTHAHGLGEQPEWLYTVRFDARELWGPGADPTVRVSTDAFEPYLEPVA